VRLANYNPVDPATWGFEVAHIQLPPKPGKIAEIDQMHKSQMHSFITEKTRELETRHAILVYRNAVKQVTIISQHQDNQFFGTTRVKNCLFATRTDGVSMDWHKALNQIIHEQRDLLLQQRPAELMVLVNYTDSCAPDLFDQVHRYTEPNKPTAKPDQFFSLLWQARKQANYVQLPNTSTGIQITNWQPIDHELTGSKIYDPFEL
jgi:hypothetical protein